MHKPTVGRPKLNTECFSQAWRPWKPILLPRGSGDTKQMKRWRRPGVLTAERLHPYRSMYSVFRLRTEARKVAILTAEVQSLTVPFLQAPQSERTHRSHPPPQHTGRGVNSTFATGLLHGLASAGDADPLAWRCQKGHCVAIIKSFLGNRLEAAIFPSSKAFYDHEQGFPRATSEVSVNYLIWENDFTVLSYTGVRSSFQPCSRRKNPK
ncbi:hypothetical protein PVAR5_7343 [Paecilomyces variotii No. 5]|uniref:Uncharacterized protein n=1 Tax=Byssochlamys spectabilis (strain No. 5 / NBRC 109023) TaxID=1356009 RepID=V5FL24_BYSSN|nr:hypothetical protein PVAR5_7343 [Paecilomyces variotii No. 5]